MREESVACASGAGQGSDRRPAGTLIKRTTCLAPQNQHWPAPAAETEARDEGGASRTRLLQAFVVQAHVGGLRAGADPRAERVVIYGGSGAGSSSSRR